MLSRLFSHGNVISRIKDEDLRDDKNQLERQQERSGRRIEEVEKSKADLFQQLLQAPQRSAKEVIASKIGALDLQVKLEQATLRRVTGQLKLIYIAEVVKGFQRRNVQSPVVQKLLDARLDDVDKVLTELVSDTKNVDSVTRELLGALGDSVPQGDKDTQDLIKLAEQYQQQMPNDPVAAAEAMRNDHNQKVGLDKETA